MTIADSAIQQLRSLAGVSVETNAAMAPLVTIRTGGRADLLVTVETVPGAVAALGVLRAQGISVYCLGSGSDLLVADAGYQGAIIKLGAGLAGRMGSEDVSGSKEHREIVAGGGVRVTDLAGDVAKAGLAGLEFACGIPGSVGGGVATNAGAYGRAFSDVLTKVELTSADGARWASVDELEWEYRHCRLPSGVIVTAARFLLERDEPARIQRRQEEILDMRRAVQPQGVHTFGSTFKNPSGGAAGRLLDAAGLKGERRGGAEVSKVHANFVVNLGDASTADVLELMNHMRNLVHSGSGVLLEPEVRLLGAEFPWRSSANEARRRPSVDG